mgnify:CR=1 FL=1
MNTVTAYDASPPLKSGGDQFAFGCDSKLAAAALRKLADQIDAGAILAQRVEQKTVAKHEDFASSSFIIEFVQKLGT